VVLVVDVSGSMEASVVYAALVAAILSGRPAVTTNFVAFSLEVLDLAEKVADPLGLLLEVSVGGGSDIARGVVAAREHLACTWRRPVVGGSLREEIEDTEAGRRPWGRVGYPLG
jgi:hypothetical protein